MPYIKDNMNHNRLISSPTFKQAYLLFCLFFLSTISVNAQTILPTNSSPEDDAAAPTGWTIIVGSTDISNKDYWAGWAAYPWEDSPDDPPNGHTRWVTGFYTESVGTTISDMTIGVEYTLNFYMAEMRSSAGGTPTLYDGTLQITIGGVDHLYPFSGGTDNSWSAQELTFTADAAEMAVAFKYEGSPGVNGNFWNISFSEDDVDPDCDDLVTTVSATDICIGETVTLTASSINDGVITWDGGVVDGEAFEPPLGTTTYTATSDNELDCVFSVDITVHDLPDVTATAEPEEICLGETVIFTGGGADTYEWDMDVEDGEAFEPLAIGTETYTVTGTDEFGCENTASVDVTVWPLPVCDFEFVINGVSSEDGATGGCVVSTVQFNDLSTVGDPGTITEWDWNFGDGTSSDEENPEHNYGASGTYTVTLTVTTAGGCSATYELDIIMTEALIMDLVFNNPTCHGFTDGSITVNVTGGLGDLIFEITDTDDNLLNEDNSNTANTLGEGWYYINVSDDSECAGIDSVYLSEPGELDIEIDLIDPLCFGDETGIAVVTEVINYTGSDDMISYIWNPNPGGNSGVGEDSTWAMGAGDYTVTINDENGCSKVFDFTITEPTQMTFPEFGFEHAFCRLHEYQSGNGVVFGSASGGTPDYSYVWTNLDNGDESINSTWGGLNPGNYELTATDANGCILQETLFLDSLNPVAAFTVVSDQLNTDCQGTATIEVEFVNESINFANPNDPGADTTFLWNLDNPNAAWQVSHDVFEVFDTIFTPQGQTYYVDVCLVALNKNGCADTTCKVVTVYEPISFDDVNIFSPNGDGINDEFTFEFKAASIAEFTCVIVNRWGIVVHEMNDINDGWDGTDKNGDPCTAGVYFYKYVAKADNSTDIVGQGSLQIVLGD